MSNSSMISMPWRPEKKSDRWHLMWLNVMCCVTKMRNPKSSDYILHDHVLERVSSAKYLGVELTEHLHWGKHIHTSTAKANKASIPIYISLKGCPATVHSQCYKSLVRPVLEYSSAVWDPHQKNLKSDPEMVQRRAARRTFIP